MCNLSSSAPPSSKVDDLTANPGSPASGEAPCCPEAADFRKHGRKAAYYGFDDKTDMVGAGTQPYWLPPNAAKTAPTNRLTRDGAVWLSVQRGQTTKCMINFANHHGCIRNSTYVVKPANVARVVTSTITTNLAEFEIQGLAAGDCTIVVSCGGKDIGWVHVACHILKSYRVALCEVNQTVTIGTGAAARTSLTLPRPAMDMTVYRNFFAECYRAACVEVSLTALARYDLPATTNLAPGGGFFDANGQMTPTQLDAGWGGTITRVTDAIFTAVKRRNPGYDKYLFLMMPTGRRGAGSYINGFARSIGSDYAIFFNSDSGVYSTAAHEFGHTIKLRHPNDPAASGQYPPHLRAAAGGDNVASNDVLNLMGYGNPRTDRKELRYMQWKSVQGR